MQKTGIEMRRLAMDNDVMPDATITVDAALNERPSDLASNTGQRVDEFVVALLRRVAEADVRFKRGVRVFPRRPGAPTLTVADVDRLADGQIAAGVRGLLDVNVPVALVLRTRALRHCADEA